MLTPTDIHNKDFKKSFRGYDPDQVDDFLDQIVNDYERLYRENSKLKDDLERKERDVERMRQLEGNLQDTLVVAQRTAEEVTRTARQKATDLRETTEKECQNLKERTAAEMERLRNQTNFETGRQIAEATARVRSIVDEYDRLVREKNKFLSMFRSTLATELASVDGVISRMPHPELEDVAPPRSQIDLPDAGIEKSDAPDDEPTDNDGEE